MASSRPCLLLKIQLTLHLATPCYPPVGFSHFSGPNFSSRHRQVYFRTEPAGQAPVRVQPLFPSLELCSSHAISLLLAQRKDWLACTPGFGDQQPPIIRCPVTPKPFKAASEVSPYRPSPSPINRDMKYYPISNIGNSPLGRSVHRHHDAKWYLQERYWFLDSNPWGKSQRLWQPRPHDKTHNPATQPGRENHNRTRNMKQGRHCRKRSHSEQCPHHITFPVSKIQQR